MKAKYVVLCFVGGLVLTLFLASSLKKWRGNKESLAKDTKNIVCITYGNRDSVAIKYDFLRYDNDKCEIILTLSNRVVNRRELDDTNGLTILLLAKGAIREMENFTHSQVSGVEDPRDERVCVISAYAEGLTNTFTIAGSNGQLLRFFDRTDSLYKLLLIASEGQYKGGKIVTPRRTCSEFQNSGKVSERGGAQP